MDFDENITKLTRELNGFSSKTTVDEKCKRLEPHFKKAKENDRGKMLFFLMLNTDLNVKKELQNVSDISYLIDICPSLKVNELCDIIVNLELINTLCDIVGTCPAVMSIEILKCLHNRILQTETKFEYCRKLAVALHDKYTKIFSMDDIESDDLFEVFLLFMPSSYKKGKEEGDALLEINCQLQIWKDCLTSRTVTDIPAFQIVFNNKKTGVISTTKVVTPTGRTRERFSEFLSDFKMILEDSSLLNCKEDSPLRKTICENAHFLYEKVKNENLMKTDEEEWLKSIMKEPETEKISEFDIDAVIDKISNYNSDRKWFKALINFPDWLEKEEALLCVMSHVDVMDLNDLKTVVECVQSVRSSTVSDKICSLYMRCLERMSLKDQVFYFNRHFEESRTFSWETTDKELTENFNKLSESDESDQKIKTWLITTCIHSPSKLITKLCKLGLSNSGVLHHCVEYLTMLRGACLSKVAEEDLDIITSALKSLIENEDLTSVEKRYLIPFVCELQKEGLLDFKFVNFCILRVIAKALVCENFEKVIFALELLKTSLKWKSVRESKEVPLAAFIVRVLSHASWDCSTFSMQLVHAREVLIPIAESMMKSSVNFNDLEKGWLRREILKSSEINQLYFCDFLFSNDCTVIPSKDLYIQLLALLHTKTKVHFIIDSVVTEFQSKKFSELRALFNLALIKVLPILTTKEWTTLFTHLKSIIMAWSNAQTTDPNLDAPLAVVDLLTFSMYCLAQDMNHYGDMLACFEFCVRNYGKVIQQNFPSDKKFEMNVRMDLARRIMFLLNGIQDSSFRKTNSMILSCVLLEITGRGDGNDEEELQHLQEWFKKDFIQ